MRRILSLILILGFTAAYAQDDRMVMPPGVVRSSMPPRPMPGLPPGAGIKNDDRDDENKYPYQLKYSGAQGSLEFILKDYATQTGRTLLIEPNKVLPQVQKGGVYIESETRLTLEEYLQAIERVLRMHKIALIPVGERFLKAVPLEEARTDGMKIDEEKDNFLPEEGKWVSQFISLKHISVDEAELSIKDFVRTGTGKIIKFETSNSLLVTDTQDNINRIMQILKRVDQPIEIREETNVRQIKFVKASDIKKHLDDLVRASQQDESTKNTTAVPKKSGSPGYTKTTPPGVIRAPTPIPTSYVSDDAAISVAERGIIRGKVQIIADDRTGTLIIITRPENMKFFDKIIDVLDVSSDPDVIVKVIPLNYADVEEVEKMINDLIGAQAKSRDKDKASLSTPKKGDSNKDTKSAALEDFVKRRQEQSMTPTAPGSSKVGQLSADNIKILANKRTNALIVMASKGDMATIQELITSMDMKLSQVLIEAVILEVGLDEGTQSGVDWVQRSLIAYNEDASGAKDPIGAFAGGGGGGEFSPLDALGLTETSGLSSALPTGGGLSYYFTHFGLSIDAVVHMAATDSKTEIVSKPVIVTHENEEAKIESSQDRYFYKGKRWVSTGTSSGTYEDDVDLKSITTSLTVTPHINEEKLVEMEIVQLIEELGPVQSIGDDDWPTTLKRELSARVAVRDGETIILGGFVKQEKTSVSKGIPFLKDLPIIGWLFGYKKDDTGRSELVVFMTPHVMDTDEEIMTESKRRREALEAGDLWDKGWSNSKFANPTKEELKEQKKAEKEDRKKAEAEEKAKQEYLKSPGKSYNRAKPKKGIIPFIRTKPDKDEEQSRMPSVSPEEVSAVLGSGENVAVKGAPSSALDPEMAEYIKRQEKRWGQKIESADEKVEKDMK